MYPPIKRRAEPLDDIKNRNLPRYQDFNEFLSQRPASISKNNFNDQDYSIIIHNGSQSIGTDQKIILKPSQSSFSLQLKQILKWKKYSQNYLVTPYINKKITESSINLRPITERKINFPRKQIFERSMEWIIQKEDKCRKYKDQYYTNICSFQPNTKKPKMQVRVNSAEINILPTEILDLFQPKKFNYSNLIKLRQ